MKIRVFQPNARGKVEFSYTELEKLLNEVYEEGRKDCEAKHPFTWTPYISTTPYYANDLTTNNTTEPISGLVCDTSCQNKSAKTEAPVEVKTSKIANKDINDAINNMIANIHGLSYGSKQENPFTALVKELNF